MKVQETAQTFILNTLGKVGSVKSSILNLDDRICSGLGKLSDKELENMLTKLTSGFITSMFIIVTGKTSQFGLVDRTVKPWFRKMNIMTAPISAALLALYIRELLIRNGIIERVTDKDISKLWQQAEAKVRGDFDAKH